VCCVCRCGRRVTLLPLNAAMTPDAMPAVQSPGHRATTRHIAHPESASPPISVTLYASTGDAPDQSTAADEDARDPCWTFTVVGIVVEGVEP